MFLYLKFQIFIPLIEKELGFSGILPIPLATAAILYPTATYFLSHMA
jgi:hypothetical protein